MVRSLRCQLTNRSMLWESITLQKEQRPGWFTMRVATNSATISLETSAIVTYLTRVSCSVPVSVLLLLLARRMRLRKHSSFHTSASVGHFNKKTDNNKSRDVRIVRPCFVFTNTEKLVNHLINHIVIYLDLTLLQHNTY